MTRAPRKRSDPSPTSPDPIEIAMEAEAHDTAPDSPARRLLLEQIDLVRAQRRSENMGAALKVLTGLAGLAVVAALGLMVWNASRADNMIIEAFSAPPALVERGVTGEVLARQLMDDLTILGDQANSVEVQRGLAGSWSQSLTLQISQTGISLGQLDQWLKDRLGHQKRISGEVMIDTGGGLALVVRSGAAGLAPVKGAQGDIAAMVQRAAENIYGHELPRSYGNYLSRQGRNDDYRAWATELTRRPSPRERALGYNFLGTDVFNALDWAGALAAYDQALEADPSFDPPDGNKGRIESNLGHMESALRLQRRQIALVAASDTRSEHSRQQSLDAFGTTEGSYLGDWTRVRSLAEAHQEQELAGFTDRLIMRVAAVRANAALHEPGRARAQLAAIKPSGPGEERNIRTTAVQTAALNEAWPELLAAADAWIATQPAPSDGKIVLPLPPAYKALALAHLGRMDEARALIAASPLDCQTCVVMRGQIAALSGQPAIADHWFSEAVRMAPSLPQANTEWGRALMARGDLAGAIARFAAANKQGPRFADPISFWGESLLKQGDAKTAVAKFAEADKLAPRWGRNHLLWGQALARLGKADEARAQFAAAAKLELTADERIELTRVSR